MTGGTDPYGGFPCVYSGTQSVRVGNPSTSETYSAGSIEQTFLVDATNTEFSYSYAVVLQDGGSGHTPNVQPYFTVGVYDQTGAQISCGMYLMTAPGTGYILAPGYTDVYYKPWSTVSINLSSYLGQTVTIRIIASDCAWEAHFGYAYLDCSCSDYGIINPAVICVGQSATLTAPAGAASYSWTPGGATTQTITVSPAITTTYTCSITTSGTTPCVFNLTTTVTVNAAGSITAANDSPVCAGQTINLTSLPDGGTTYSWTGPNGFTSNVQNPTLTSPTTSTAGTYNVTVTFAGGCTGTASTVVTINSNATVTVSSNSPICEGQTLNLTSLPAGGTNYSWTGPNGFTSTVQDPSIASSATTDAGTYFVTVTLTGGCTGTGQTVVTINPNPTVTVSNNGPVCAGQTLNLTPLPTGGTAYSWTGPNSFTSAVQNPSITSATTAESGTYDVTVTLAGGCTGTGQTIAVVNPNPTVTVPSNITICNGATVSATAFTSTPAGATYTWTNSNTAIGLSAGGNGDVPTFTATNTGSTSISATISVTATLNGCTGIASTYTITVDPTPLVSNTPLSQTICNDGNTSLVTLTSNVSGATFNWTATATAGITGFTASGTATIPVQTINNSGTTAGTVTYTITPTANGCIGTSSNYIITINPTPTVTVSNNSPICAGQTLNLNSSATNGTSYNWTGPNTYTSSAQNPSITTVTLGANGTYDVTITLANGCTGTGQTTVTINDNITVTASSNSPICAGQSLNLTSLPASAVSYNWTGPNNYTSNAQNPTITSATTSATGNYSVLVTDNNGCTGTASLSAIINPIPTSTFEFTQINCFGNNSTVTYTGDGISGATYTWDFGTATVVSGSGQGPYSINYTTAGTFPVSLQVTQYGCVSNTTSQNIINPTLLNLTLAKTDVTCYGINNGSVTSTVSGGTLPYSYLWSSGSVFFCNSNGNGRNLYTYSNRW